MSDQTNPNAGPGAAHPTPERIMALTFGFTAPYLIDAAVKNGVIDLLDSGPLTAAEVAAKTGASERGIKALLGGLLAFELLRKDAENRYSLSPDVAAFLVSTKPAFFGNMVRHFTEQLVPNWRTLSEIVRTGNPARSVNQEEGGSEFFEQFVESLFPNGYPAASALAQELRVAESSHGVSVLDIAAGSGVWGIAIAQASPNVTVTAVDWANVLGVTRRVATRFGLADRFTYLAGDLADVKFGTDYNVATLGHILHSEGEAKSRKLIRKVYDALAPGGTIAIAEFLVNNERTGPPMGLVFAVNMLVNTDEGDTWSFEHIADWLSQTGFANPRLLPVPGPSPLILATKP